MPVFAGPMVRSSELQQVSRPLLVGSRSRVVRLIFSVSPWQGVQLKRQNVAVSGHLDVYAASEPEKASPERTAKVTVKRKLIQS